MKDFFMMKIKDIYQLYLKTASIYTDTRKIEGAGLFFALKGENFNGNKFAAQALSNGCTYVIVDEVDCFIDNKSYILVDDALKALQQLAKYHRAQLKIPIIGITGSNGKTTTKELLHSVLSSQYKVLATKGNYNNHIGVPLTLLEITKEHQMAIIEMGTNAPGEIEFLCDLANPSHGLIM